MRVQHLDEIKSHIGCEAFIFLQDLLANPSSAEAYIGKWVHFSENKPVKCILLAQSASSKEVMEYHNQYSDIHVTLSGKDRMYVGENVKETIKNFDSVEDYGLVKVRKSKKYLIRSGSFMLIKPGVLHVNLLESGAIKVVFKLKKKND